MGEDGRRAKMGERLNQLIVEAGTEIFTEGDFGDCAYIVERGAVEIALGRGEQRVVLSQRRAGEVFGEIAIIDQGPRTATVTALERCELLMIDAAQLHRRLEDSDPILRMCLHVLIDRFRDMIRSKLVESSRIGTELVAGLSKEQHRTSYEQVVGALKLEHELAQAIHQEDFELHYQPMIELQEGRIAGLEALVRWRHRERGLIPPMLFIPAAESSGLIAPLGRWCLKEACRAQRRFTAALPDGHPSKERLFVSVNVTSRDLADGDFVPHLDSIIEETGIDPTQLKLEITETLLMQDPDVACETLNRCRVKGLSIAIDDFGTGYSSLSYLHRFPIDTLKIDRSFIAAMSEDAANREIIRTIVGLGRQLNKPVVAEGIEELHQAVSIRDMGATYGQGYYFSKPQDEATITQLLLRWDAAMMSGSDLRVAG